jgi:hypothetical protein
MVQQALHFAERWKLNTHIQEDRYDHLIMTAGIWRKRTSMSSPWRSSEKQRGER